MQWRLNSCCITQGVSVWAWACGRACMRARAMVKYGHIPAGLCWLLLCLELLQIAPPFESDLGWMQTVNSVHHKRAQVFLVVSRLWAVFDCIKVLGWEYCSYHSWKGAFILLQSITPQWFKGMLYWIWYFIYILLTWLCKERAFFRTPVIHII